ncbi:hypothetical protein RXV86_11155 [Alisedimentitalea sp. MJ-SS2]|uniref:hypothetical protein n=1 Tax=Aliisedimentitalea sp. MJ-SS2 TaxID=3049795 RepID=UPI002914B442|nr:hypothetical protein [Alisedimentitalea sp. MJ-SS2]MDU8927942.1 hypothetical protein [Alisedimentitalea sp. MJ-SS2]
MKLFLVCITFVLGIATPVFADVKQCQALYTAGPKSLGGLALKSGKNYEKSNRGGGYALQYGTLGKTWATLFFFDMQRKKIREKHLVDELGRATRAAIEARLVMLANKGITEAGQETPMEIGGEGTFPGVLYMESKLFLEPKGHPVTNDYVTVGVVNNCIVKLRFSSQGNRKASNRKFEKMKRELRKAVK